MNPTANQADGSKPGRRARLDDAYRVQVPAEPAISPDGSTVIYVLRTTDRDADCDRRALWRVSTSGGAPQPLTRGTADSAPAWSPDGSQVAFLRAEEGPPQIWVLPVAGGEPEQVTELPAGAGPPVWSPGGTQLAFAAPAGSAPPAGHEPVVADRLGYKADGAGLRTFRLHVHVLDLADGSVRQVSRGSFDASSPAWSPDGRTLAFTAASPDAGADLSAESAVYLADLSEAVPRARPAGFTGMLAGAVSWTPDGAALLVTGSPELLVKHAGLWRVPADGSAPANMTAGLDRNVMPGAPGYPGGQAAIARDGTTVLFCATDRGCTGLFAVRPGQPPRPVLSGSGQVVAGLSVARHADRAAVIIASPASFGEVAVLDLPPGPDDAGTAPGADPRIVTAHTRQALPDVGLLTPAEREFTISDGTTVHGWLLRDPAAPVPAPLLLDIHGGPHNAWSPEADDAHLYHQVLAARGFAVLTLNPRGSDGYGEQFFTGVIGGWGEADENDFLEPLDQLVAEGIADPARLAVSGYSYGGFMTCHLTTRTGRFAAAVGGGVVSDLASMAGTSDLGHFLAALELGAVPHSDRARIRELSPIERVGQVTTPTLILHGEADDRCPRGQAEQWFTALRERGVPSRLVLYPGGSHLFMFNGRPSHRIDYAERLVSWVSDYTRPGSAGTRMPAARGLDNGYWQSRLAELAAQYEVPGATLGVLRMAPGGGTPGGPEDELMLAAHGLLSTATGVEVTTDSLFQIGSITKVWTTTLLMQLAEQGRVDLDAPLEKVLPGLVLPGELAEHGTIRHLLTHTLGLDGDVFDDVGRGDDCVARYVAALAGAGLTHPLGATFSYCNSGFVLAGRIVEVVTGKTWDEALAEMIARPLGLTRTCTLPEEVLLHRAATGHVNEPGEPPHPASVWSLPRGVGPAGLICSTAEDLLGFARLHLAGGLARDGSRLLSAGSVTAMQDKHASLPAGAGSLADSWGLGWMRFHWDGSWLVGHDGGTIGQYAFLRLIPDRGLAVALLTNGGHAGDLYQDLFGEILADLAGVRMPRPAEPAQAPPPVEAGRFTGVYERASQRLEVLTGQDGLRLRSTVTGPLAAYEEEPTREYALHPVSDGLFVLREPGAASWSTVTFYQLPDGTACVHYGGRANPRRP